jgi:hypothetical protein
MATLITKIIIKNNYADARYCVFTGTSGQTPVISWDNFNPTLSGTVGSSEVSPGVYVSDSIPAFSSDDPLLEWGTTNVTVDIGGSVDSFSFNQVGKTNRVTYGFPNNFVESINTSGAPASNVVVWEDYSGDTGAPDGNFTAYWDSSYKFDVVAADLGYSNSVSNIDRTNDLANDIVILTTTVEPNTVPLGGTVYFMGKAYTTGWAPHYTDNIILYSYTNGSASPPEPFDDRNFFRGGQELGTSLPGTLSPSRPYSNDSFIDSIESRYKL